MRIYFFAPFCLLRATTNRIFDVRLCDALAGKGADVRMVHPYYAMKENIDAADIRRVYGTRHALHFRMLKTKLKESHSAFRQACVLVLAFSFQLLKIIFSRQPLRKTVIMSRDIKLLVPAVLLRKLTFRTVSFATVVHVHEVRNDRFSRWIYKNADGIWTTTQAATDKIRNTWGIPADRFQSICACVPPPENPGREEARKQIGYPGERPLAVYTGKLGKGIRELEYILDAAALLPDVNFLFTGGKDDTLAYMKTLCSERKLSNTLFSGFVREVSFVRMYQAAADVLVSYYSAQDHSVEYNLPQKLMEYMFSGNPVVTPDFAASRPFVNTQTACIVAPDNPASLASGIRELLDNPAQAQLLARRAMEAVKEMTFERRAAGLLQSLERKP